MDLKAQAKSIFARYSKENTVNFTTDGQAFFQMHFAQGHAQSLKDKSIVTINRKDFDAPPVDEAAAALAAARCGPPNRHP